MSMSAEESKRYKRRLMTGFVRYHFTLKGGRTTVSLDNILSDLLALKLGMTPETPEAHQAVRQKLDSLIPDRGNDGRTFGRVLKREAMLFLVDKRLSDKYNAYILEEPLPE